MGWKASSYYTLSLWGMTPFACCGDRRWESPQGLPDSSNGPFFLPSLLDLFKSLFLTHQIHFKFGNKLESWYNFICCKAGLITVHRSCRCIKKGLIKKGVLGSPWFRLYRLTAVWLWASDLTSQSLQFLICKMGITIRASQGCWED